MKRRPAAAFSLFLFFALVLQACGGSDQPSTSSTVTPEATATAPAGANPNPGPTRVVPNEVDGGRILQYVRHLSETIGPRPAGSEAEKAAAEFIAEKLREFGYEVTFHEFTVSTEASRQASFSVRPEGGEPRTIPSLPFDRSGSGQVRAFLVPAGRGGPSEFPGDTAGNIALIERGDLLFAEKIANAQRAGAVAVVIYNNEPGIFFGSAQQASIPAVSIAQSEGQLLIERLKNGRVEAAVGVAAPGSATSRNVVAKPPGRECATITGGHYDSVQQAPGASDNATGTSAVLEIAAVIAGRGEMASNCFVLFGGEELGLLGSRAFVDALTAGQRSVLKAMLNYDMVGVGSEGWLLIGNADLQSRAVDVARDLGINVTRGNLPNNTSSDHASFQQAGIPALMLHRFDDPLLHTPEDVVARVDAGLLADAARLGVALLESLNRGG